MSIEELKSRHKLLKKYSYPPTEIERGYNNRTLYINLNDNRFLEKPVTGEMKEKFIGGKGFDLWLLWNAVKGGAKWTDPENTLCIAAGPMGGTRRVFPGGRGYWKKQHVVAGDDG